MVKEERWEDLWAFKNLLFSNSSPYIVLPERWSPARLLLSPCFESVTGVFKLRSSGKERWRSHEELTRVLRWFGKVKPPLVAILLAVQGQIQQEYEYIKWIFKKKTFQEDLLGFASWSALFFKGWSQGVTLNRERFTLYPHTLICCSWQKGLCFYLSRWGDR